MIEDERRAQQISLDKISADGARSRASFAETEAGLTAPQGRLRHVEGNFAELSTERTRLASAFAEARNGTSMSSRPNACGSMLSSPCLRQRKLLRRRTRVSACPRRRDLHLRQARR